MNLNPSYDEFYIIVSNDEENEVAVRYLKQHYSNYSLEGHSVSGGDYCNHPYWRFSKGDNQFARHNGIGRGHSLIPLEIKQIRKQLKGENRMLQTIKETTTEQVQEVKDFLKEHKKLIVYLMAALFIDKTMLGGKGTDAIAKLATKIRDKCVALVEKSIDKLGLSETEPKEGE